MHRLQSQHRGNKSFDDLNLIEDFDFRTQRFNKSMFDIDVSRINDNSPVNVSILDKKALDLQQRSNNSPRGV